MAEEASVGAIESALEGAFSDVAPETPKAVARPAPVEAAPELEAEPDTEGGEDLISDDSPEAEAVEAAPELEVEIDMDGAPEVIRGNDRVKELVAKGLKAGRAAEENARTRDALVAHVEMAQVQQEFHGHVFQDIQNLNTVDAQLKQYDQIDWNAAYDSNAFEALKLKEQRDQLREYRNGLVQGLQHKEAQFKQFTQQNRQKLIAAEEAALVAKLPEWRNSEKGLKETGEIRSWLATQGFQPEEVGLIPDHRHMLIARKAFLYDRLIANRDAKVKQVRAAPALARPGVANAQPNSRTDFQKARAKIKEFGTKGNSRAAENLATAMFEKTFGK